MLTELGELEERKKMQERKERSADLVMERPLERNRRKDNEGKRRVYDDCCKACGRGEKGKEGKEGVAWWQGLWTDVVCPCSAESQEWGCNRMIALKYK